MIKHFENKNNTVLHVYCLAVHEGAAVIVRSVPSMRVPVKFDVRLRYF